MTNNDYSPSLVSAIKLAQSMARQERQSTYGVPHLVLAMLTESTGLKEILQSMQKDVAYLMDWFDTRKEMYTSSESDSDEICADDEQSKLGTRYSVPQIAFYKAIVSLVKIYVD